MFAMVTGALNVDVPVTDVVPVRKERPLKVVEPLTERLPGRFRSVRERFPTARLPAVSVPVTVAEPRFA